MTNLDTTDDDTPSEATAGNGTADDDAAGRHMAPPVDSLRLNHSVGEGITLSLGRVDLLRYVYRDQAPPEESPKPYLHPIRTLAGDIVTGYRPHDHVWHKGIQLTCAHLSEDNFWGGPTFVRGQGYRQLDNNGAVQHTAWDEISCDGTTARLAERLTWLSRSGERRLEEKRTLQLGSVDAQRGCWTLGFDTELRNVSGRALSFGSPTTHGRPDAAGYGGLFWRGPQSFTGGTVLTADGEGAAQVMGRPSAWLAYIGRHDENDRPSTVLVVDAPTNPRHPTQWFVRSSPFPVLSAAFMFDRELELPAGETLALRYTVVIATGAWSRERIGAFVAGQVW
jgi:hypothetical protein